MTTIYNFEKAHGAIGKALDDIDENPDVNIPKLSKKVALIKTDLSIAKGLLSYYRLNARGEKIDYFEKKG